ncbi:MAG: hypothetical protein WCI02_16825 [Planctomycetota bacterium]
MNDRSGKHRMQPQTTQSHSAVPPNVVYTTDSLPSSSNKTGVVSKQSNPQSKWEQLLSNRRSILLLLFCVTGFLGLPLLWMSHAFSRAEKIAWSIVNTLFTLALIGISVAICYWCYNQLVMSGVL